MPCTADQLPLLKILLHAAKYSHSNINGILLGSASGSSIKVTDAIPLFHNSICLAAPTEIALSQIEAYTQQGEGRPQIVGYYHSDARLQSADMDAISRRLADRLSERFPQIVVLLLDNKKLSAFLKDGGSSGEAAVASTSHPFELFLQSESKGWKRESQEQIAVSGAGLKGLRETFFGLFQQLAHRKLNDFDDHLDDLSKDFLNPQLTNLGKASLHGNQL